MARRFAKVSAEEIKTAFFYPSDLVNTKTTIPLGVGEERWIYTSTLRVSVYIHGIYPLFTSPSGDSCTIAHFLFCIFKCVLKGIDQNQTRPVYNTRTSYMPYSLRIVCGFFYVPMFFFFVCEQKRVERQSLWFIALIREEVKV